MELVYQWAFFYGSFIFFFVTHYGSFIYIIKTKYILELFKNMDNNTKIEYNII